MANTTSTTSFRADISQLKSAMQQAARQVKVANAEFKAATAGLDDWSQSAVGLNAKLKQLDSTLGAQKKQLALLEKELELTSKEYGENSAAADRVRIALNNQKAAIAKTEKQIEEYDKDLKNAEKYGDNFTDTMDEMTAAAEEASDGFTTMKGVLANLIADGIRKAASAIKDFAKDTITAGMNFESAMSKVGAISNASSEDMQKLTDKAKEMGEKTVFSASESAQAFQYMAMAGWKTEDMLNGIEGIMNLAAASGEDLATTSDIVTDALTAMGYSAGDAGRLADVMAAASSNANTNVSLMGQTFQYAAPIIGALGYNMEDAAVAIGLMANAGIKGQKSGTALRSILTRLSAPPKECAEAMEELGISLTDSEGNMKSLDQVMQDLRQAFDGLSETQQTQYAKAIAGQEAMSGLLSIVNAASGDYDKLTDAIKASSGASEEMANKMNDNVAGQMTLLKSKIEGIQIEIYDHLKPALKDAVSTFSDSLDKVDWSKVGNAIGEVLKKLLGFFKVVIENIEGIIDVTKSVGTVLIATFAVNKIIGFVQAIAGFVKTMQALKAATEAAEGAQKLLNLAQAATPIGLVTAAVAGLTTAIVYFATKTKETKQVIADLTEAEKEQISTVYATRDAYADMKTARDNAVESVNAEYDNYKSLLEELDSLVDANGKVKEGYEDRAAFIVTTLNSAIGSEMELVDGVIQNYKDEKEAIEKLIETKKAEAILDANKESYTKAIREQNKALQEYINTTKIYNDATDRLAEQEKELARLSGLTAEEYAVEIGRTDNLRVAGEELYKAQKELAESIDSTKISVGQAHQAMDTAEATYISYISTIKNYEGLSSAIISKDAEKISEALTNMNADFITAETGTKQSLEKQVTNMKQNYEALKQAVADGSAVVTEEMVKEAELMVTKAVNELDKFEDKAKTSGSSGMQAYIIGMQSKQKDVDIQAEAIRIQASKTLGADVSGFEQAGKDAGQGYLDGMGLKVPDVLKFATGMGSDAVDALNKGQDSHSPSAKTTTSGENFGQGFINGMDNKKSSIWDKAYSLAQRAIAALKAGQKEGSPSKITYQSGVYFVEGYMNGIASMQGKLQSSVQKMVVGAFKELNKLSGYNFSEVANNASTKFAESISSRMTYMIKRIQYENEKKISAINSDIDLTEKEKEIAIARDQNVHDKEILRLQKERDKLIAPINAKIEKLENSGNEKDRDRAIELKKQVANIEKEYDTLIKAEEKAAAKSQKALEKFYDQKIKELKDFGSAYESASKEFLDEFQTVMSEYQAAAQNLINDTINGITTRYNQRYDTLINKQNSLIEKMKSAGELFTVSGAGVMTINDITEQTRQIKDYTSKLANIKNKVSAELFDEITSFDMKEGSAYIDRLLSMSSEELEAYNDSYTKLLETAQKSGEKIYKKDFAEIAKDYKAEIAEAFKTLPAQLEELGEKALKGFIDGLTTKTDYLDANVKTLIKAMIDSFKSEIGITVNASGSPIDVSRSLTNARSILGTSDQPVSVNNSTVNNYNLVQNNTSPKSLSALETFQARREQIELIKAFG